MLAETRKLRKAADEARNAPGVACPASRHVHMIADALAKGKKYHQLDEEPEHCAGSFYSVITSLWNARAELAALRQSKEVDDGKIAF